MNDDVTVDTVTLDKASSTEVAQTEVNQVTTAQPITTSYITSEIIKPKKVITISEIPENEEKTVKNAPPTSILILLLKLRPHNHFNSFT